MLNDTEWCWIMLYDAKWYRMILDYAKMIQNDTDWY